MEIARALINRGATKEQLGDPNGEMADYNAVISLAGVPAEALARALINRGDAKGKQGDALPPEQREFALEVLAKFEPKLNPKPKKTQKVNYGKHPRSKK